MKINFNNQNDSIVASTENLAGNNMSSLLNEVQKDNFSDTLRNLLQLYKKSAKEKIWIDIESYQAG